MTKPFVEKLYHYDYTTTMAKDECDEKEDILRKVGLDWLER